MINNVVFPHSVEVRPSFVIARLKDEPDGATTTATRIIAKFVLVKNFSLDAYGNPTVPHFHDPVFMDVETKRMIDPSTFAIVTSFDPNNIGSAVLKLQQEVAERDAKINTLDKMVKQLSAGYDPRVQNLNASNEVLRRELNEATRVRNEQKERVEDLLDDLRRQSQTLASSGKDVRELKEKVTKLTNDLMATARDRDNRVEELAKEKANEMLPNLRRDVEHYRNRAKELAAENGRLKDDLANAEECSEIDSQRLKDTQVPLWRKIRKLERKVHKAGGREKYWIRQLNNTRFIGNQLRADHNKLKTNHKELQTKLDTVNAAFAAERKFSKEQVEVVEDLKALLDKPLPLEVHTPTIDGKTINVTLNLCGNVTINELNNYN